MADLDPQALSLLNDDERAAVEGKDDDDVDALKAVAEGDDEGDEDEGDEPEEKGEAAEPAAAEAAPAPAKAEVEAAASEPAPAASKAGEDDEAPIRSRQSTLPADFDARVQANKEAIALLRKQRDDGELTITEYDAKLDELSEIRDDLRAERSRHDAVQQMRIEDEAALKLKHQNRIIAQAASEGLDYAKTPRLVEDFNLFFGPLVERAQAEGRSLKWVYDETHRRVAALHGKAVAAVADPTPTPKPKTAAEAKAAEAKKRQPDLSQTPRSIAQAPGGDSPSDLAGDEFADIDELDGMDYEEAIAARMKRDSGFAEKFTANARLHRAGTRH